MNGGDNVEGGWRLWLATYSPWTHYGLLLLTMVPGLCSIAFLLPEGDYYVSGAVVGGLAVASYRRDGYFWKLDRAERRRVTIAAVTGESTGERGLDKAAIQLLRSAKQSRITAWLLPALLVVAPTVCAVVDNYLWLFACVPAILMAFNTKPWAVREPADVRLNRLIESSLSAY